MTAHELIEQAYRIAGEYRPSRDCTSGSVSAALVTEAGHVYTGVCIDASCGLGFCAEHAAIAEMLKHRESAISMIVAVNAGKNVLPPCGRCRELIYQVNNANLKTRVVFGDNNTVELRDLLPYRWQEAYR